MAENSAVYSSLWMQCARALEAELSEQQYNTWIRPLQLVEDGPLLKLAAIIEARNCLTHAGGIVQQEKQRLRLKIYGIASEIGKPLMLDDNLFDDFLQYMASHALAFVTFVPAADDLAVAIDHLRAAQVEGVIVEAPVDPVVDALAGLQTDLPIVVVGGDPLLPQSTVAVDQAAGGRLATEHLLGLGHRTVHHVRGDAGWVDAAGNGAWAVSVRCAEIDGSTARVWAGNGIVAGSDPVTELAETRIKFQAMLSALVRP